MPAEIVFKNHRVKIGAARSVPDRNILVRESPGGIRPAWAGNILQPIQVITRDKDAPKARALAYDVYNLLNDRIGLILPATTVDGVIYPAFQTAQISSTNVPYPIGPDANGRFEFSINLNLIYGR